MMCLLFKNIIYVFILVTFYVFSVIFKNVNVFCYENVVRMNVT